MTSKFTITSITADRLSELIDTHEAVSIQHMPGGSVVTMIGLDIVVIQTLTDIILIQR